ncbi:hypothetical protein AAHA92_02584 [Salvia divinorum]|uniref:Uncharacterized protein n=1 Tax=Salvia divinorum TaxID=28513 RepID=A0ABD1IEC7_SALDI
MSTPDFSPKSQLISSNAYLPSLIQFGVARSYTTKGDRHNDADSDGTEESADEIDFDNLESFNESEIDDKDRYEDSYDNTNAK